MYNSPRFSCSLASPLGLDRVIFLSQAVPLLYKIRSECTGSAPLSYLNREKQLEYLLQAKAA